MRSAGKDWYESRKVAEGNHVAVFTGPTFKRPVINLTGRTFGHLLVLGVYGRLKAGKLGWLCMCKCKNTHITTGTHLMNGRVTSCGCRGIVPGKCTKCNQIKPLDQFALDKRNKSGRGRWCYECQQAATRKWAHENIERLAHKQRERYRISAEYRGRVQAKHRSRSKRTPKWADLELIAKFYRERPEGLHVDHIIPLKGKLVSGLNVLENLQYLPATENQRKRNKFEPLFELRPLARLQEAIDGFNSKWLDAKPGEILIRIPERI